MAVSEPKYTLSKTQKLKHQKGFDILFAHSKSVKKFPVRLVYVPLQLAHQNGFSKEITHSQVAFSVPKKKFKKAVDRNRIKRQMREIHRLQQHHLPQPMLMLWIYMSPEKWDFAKLDVAMLECIQKIS